MNEVTLWCLDALLSVGAIGRGYATTLGELGSHRHGQRGAKRGGLLVFVVKTKQRLGLLRLLRHKAELQQAPVLAQRVLVA